MWRRCAFWSGVLLIAVALAAVPSAMIVTSYVGGSAIGGYVEDGRYFVDPRHGMPVVEVSKSTWWTVYRVERVWPFSALVPGLIGIFLTVHGMGANWKRAPIPRGDPPPWFLWACGVGAVITVAGAWLCWNLVRIPWVVQLVGWILFCVTCGTVIWLYTRYLRQQSNAESGAADDHVSK